MKRIIVALVAAFAVLSAPAALAAVAPVVTTGAATSVSTMSATLTGTVNPAGQATTYYYEYGPTSSYGSTTPAASAGNGTTAVSAMVPVGSLTPNTTYHYRLVASNATGPAMGTDQTFTTASAPPGVSGTGVKSVTAASATLTGTVNPEDQATTYHFQYGLTKSYGSVTASASAGSGTKNVSVAAMIGSLTPNTTYHYRLVATNASRTTTGSDKSFKTAKLPTVTISAIPRTIVFGKSTTLRGKVTGPAHTAVTLQRAASATGPFTDVVSTISTSVGAYSFVTAPGSNAFYRAVANGVSGPPVRVAVRFRNTLSVSTTHPRLGERVHFRGRVAPAHNGLRVRIERLGSDGRWRTLARPRLHSAFDGVSAYSIRIAVRRGGLYRAAVGPDAHHAKGFSRMIRIRLR